MCRYRHDHFVFGFDAHFPIRKCEGQYECGGYFMTRRDQVVGPLRWITQLHGSALTESFPKSRCRLISTKSIPSEVIFNSDPLVASGFVPRSSRPCPSGAPCKSQLCQVKSWTFKLGHPRLDGVEWRPLVVTYENCCVTKCMKCCTSTHLMTANPFH